MRRVSKYVKFLVCLQVSLFIGVSDINASSNPYNKMQTIEGVTTVSCTYFAWEEAYNNLGIELPRWGNAVNWYERAKKGGFEVGSIPRVNSIAVWKNSNNVYGHVAYVTNINGNNMTINEGGITALKKDINTELIRVPFNGDGIYYGNVVSISKRNETSTLLGFIYLTKEEVIEENKMEIQETVEEIVEEPTPEIEIPITPSATPSEVKIESNRKEIKKTTSKNNNDAKIKEEIPENNEVVEEIPLEEEKKEEQRTKEETINFSFLRNLINLISSILLIFIKK